MAKRQAPALKQRTKSEQTKKARSGKGTRGGAGRGQGRKKVLTYMEMILLGGACEDLWRRLMERKAWAEYRNQPHVKDIHQERIALSGALLRDVPHSGELHVSADGLISWSERPLFRRSSSTIKATIRQVSVGINDILYHARRAAGQPTPKFKRLVTIPLERPKGERDRVRRVVVRWARCAHRIVVSPRRVADCWEQYRKDFPTDVDFHTK